MQPSQARAEVVQREDVGTDKEEHATAKDSMKSIAPGFA